MLFFANLLVGLLLYRKIDFSVNYVHSRVASRFSTAADLALYALVFSLSDLCCGNDSGESVDDKE